MCLQSMIDDDTGEDGSDGNCWKTERKGGRSNRETIFGCLGWKTEVMGVGKQR